MDEAFLTGQIDRIDCGEVDNETGEKQPYFLVVDYKTGDEKLSLPEVYYGLRLQLLTYMEAARRFFGKHGKEEMRPAGVLYCLLKNPVMSGSAKMSREDASDALLKDLRMKGWLLGDAKVIRELDASNQFLCVRLKNESEIDGHTKRNARTGKEFDALAAHTMKKLREAGEKVLFP